MKFFFLLSFPALIINKCANHSNTISSSAQTNTNDSIPVCIQKKIESIKKEPKWNPSAQTDQYIYNGKMVFLFSANCCDQYSVLYDENCQIICAPTGGFTGKGDGKCDDFFRVAKHIKLIWKDPR